MGRERPERSAPGAACGAGLLAGFSAGLSGGLVARRARSLDRPVLREVLDEHFGFFFVHFGAEVDHVDDDLVPLFGAAAERRDLFRRVTGAALLLENFLARTVRKRLRGHRCRRREKRRRASGTNDVST